MNRIETCRHERSAGVESPSRFPIEREVRASTSKSTTIPASLSEAMIHSIPKLRKIQSGPQRNVTKTRCDIFNDHLLYIKSKCDEISFRRRFGTKISITLELKKNK